MQNPSSQSHSSRKAGVFYAVSNDGLELPIVDVTHPEFSLSVGPAEQQLLISSWLKEQAPFRKLPAWLRGMMMKLALRKSVLGRALMSANGTYLSGLNTYLMKLGPNNLGAVTGEAIDLRIAASLPMLSIRLRLQDVATLLADFLAADLLADRARPLHLINIAGGPTMDSLNALLVLNRDHPGALAGRRVLINVLDLDTAGPAFGARALSSLSVPGGPLHGLNVELRHRSYDWSRAADLAPVLDAAMSERALVAASSEGGLFDYGSDEEVVSNLEMLRPAVSVVVGSVTRNDPMMRSMLAASSVTLRPRGHAVFGALALKAGWKVAKVIERPVCDQVALLRSTG
jgi:hypothetical protein